MLTSLPAGRFDELYSLRTLRLHDNGIAAPLVDIFDRLFVLETLMLHGNEVTDLPVGMFDDLSPFGGGPPGTRTWRAWTGLRVFATEHSPTSVEDFTEALPELHKERVALVYESRGLGAEHVSPSHPRVVSWGVTGEFVVRVAVQPRRAGEFRALRAVLHPRCDVVDRRPHRLLRRRTRYLPAGGGSELPWHQHQAAVPGIVVGLDRDVRRVQWAVQRPRGVPQVSGRVLEGHAASTNPRISPPAIDFPEYNGGRHQRLFTASEGAVAYE